MQPYVPQSTALPPPTAANRPIDPSVQTLVGQLLMAQQQQPAPAPGQELQGADGEPIRPEATRALAQVLGATSQAGAQNLLQMTGGHQTYADHASACCLQAQLHAWSWASRCLVSPGWLEYMCPASE